jgi:CHAT domain-containing protein/tetratricopeptide (TPR) repeat protein
MRTKTPPFVALTLVASILLPFCINHTQAKTKFGDPPFSSVRAQDEGITLLGPDKPIERELLEGQMHSYRLSLAAGDFLRVVAEQRGVNVGVAIFAPDGRQIAEVDNSNDPKGSEEVLLVADVAGEYQLKIRALEKEKAAGRYEVRVKEQRAATAQDNVAFADWLLRQATKLRGARQFDEAILLAQRALSIQENTLRSDHPKTANSLSSLGLSYREKRDFNRAAEYLQRALAVAEKESKPDDPQLVTPLNNLAVVYREKGDYARAERLYERLLKITEKQNGSESVEFAQALNAMAFLHQLKGEYARAEPLLERTLAIVEKRRGVDHPDTATVLNNVAAVYSFKGDYKRAEPLYRRALEIYQKKLKPEDLLIARSMNNLASLYLAMGDYTQAESLYQRALEMREKARGPEHVEVAQALNNLAAVYQEKGEIERAEPQYQRALAIYQKAGASEHPEVARASNNLAMVMLLKGDYAGAEPMYQRALQIREKILGPQHPLVAKTLDTFAVLYDLKGDIPQAIELRNRGLEIRERALGPILLTGSEEQKRAYLTQAALSDENNITISLHARSAPDDPRAAGMALNLILQRKGRVLDAMTDSIGTLRRHLDPQSREPLEQLSAVNSRLATLTLGEQGGAGGPQYRAEVTRLEAERQRWEAAISSRSAEFGLQLRPVALDQVQKLIPQDAALVEIAIYQPFDQKAKKVNERFGPARYIAYVLKPVGPPSFVELGAAAAIDRAVADLRKALRNPKRTGVKRLARKVDEQVMRPVRALLGGTRQVLLSPDGVLNLVPFAALVDERRQYLVNRYSFHYLTSGRDLLRLQAKQESKSEDLVLADPAYGEKDADEKTLAVNRDIVKKTQAAKTDAPQLSQSVSMDQVFFRPLPGTAGEAEALKRLLPRARVLTKEQATETVLKQADRPHILHIATHGYFLQDLKLTTANTAMGEAPRLLTMAPSGEKIENPLLRSGLALAGANPRRSGEEDGILTALEAAGLDLWGTKLVALSACDTGVGEVRNGEGVYGLRRALVLAGSETQVMSLWPVSDTATRDLMVDYYRRLQRGEGRGEALRQVQLQMLRNPKRQHPYYWASFIQSGEWANLEGKR